MDDNSMKFLQSLLAAPSPSGHEEIARKVWRDEVSGFSDEIRTGIHGSETAILRGQSDKVRVLLMGHIDEIGLIVQHIDENGFLYFHNVGGIDPVTLVSQPVRLLGPKGIVHGVIGKLAIHLLDAEARKKMPELSDLWIDIGAKNRDEAAAHAPVGTSCVVGGDSIPLLNGRIAARCFDNKMGAFVVAEVLRKLHERRSELFATVYGAATVQEETGVWDAGPVTFEASPCVAIAIDVSHSLDIPGSDKRKHGDVVLGKGPAITIGVRSSNRLVEALREAAVSRGIQYQIEVEAGKHSTDADPASASRAGVPVTSLGVATRYMHTGVEVVDPKDIDELIELIVAYLLRIRGPIDYRP